MRFPGIRLVEQTEQKIPSMRVCLEEKKLKKTKIFIFGKKISQCRKKIGRGDPLGFSNIHSVAKQQKS